MTLVVSLKMDQNRVILMPSTAFCLLPPSNHCGKFSHTVKVSQISNKSLMERILCIRHCVRCLTYTFINSLNTTTNQQTPFCRRESLFKHAQINSKHSWFVEPLQSAEYCYGLWGCMSAHSRQLQELLWVRSLHSSRQRQTKHSQPNGVVCQMVGGMEEQK